MADPAITQTAHSDQKDRPEGPDHQDKWDCPNTVQEVSEMHTFEDNTGPTTWILEVAYQKFAHFPFGLTNSCLISVLTQYVTIGNLHSREI